LERRVTRQSVVKGTAPPNSADQHLKRIAELLTPHVVASRWQKQRQFILI